MDPVRLKLDAIDSQLASPHPLEVCTGRMPLLLPTISVVLGILMASHWIWPPVLWFVCLMGSPLILFYRGTHRFIIMACLACLAMGGLRLACFTHLPQTDISHAITDQDVPATLTGRIITPPKRVETDWHYASQYPVEPGQSFDMGVEGVYSGTIRVYVTEPVETLSLGTHITLHGRLSRLTPAPNPGQFDMARYQARRNCYVMAFVKSPLSIEIHRDTPSLWLRILRARTDMQQRMAQTLTKPDQDTAAQSALLQALILGMRTDVPGSTLQAFQTTGLLHLISLSGLHVGILMSLVWIMGQCLGLLKPARSVLCLCVLAGFLWLVPLRAATLRAGLIAGLFCTAILLRRRPNPVNTLSLAALILLLIRPTQLFEAGWQLSFSSVLGILLISTPVDAWLRQHFLLIWPIPKAPLGRVTHHILRWFLTLLAVGLGAWLGSVALLAYHFYSITPLSILYTLIALPVVALILMIGFVHILAVLICPWIHPVTLTLLNALSSVLLYTVHGLGLFHGSRILLGHISWHPVTLYYVLLLAGLLWKKQPIPRILIPLAIILPWVCIHLPKLWQDRHPSLQITCLSVGHGQALVLHTPDNHTLLFDAGSLYQKDIGRRIVSMFLDYSGIDSVDAIIASHNDADHINGIPEIMEHCQVSHVYAPALMIDQAQRNQGPAPWLQHFLCTQNRSLEPFPASLSPQKDLLIQQLWPAPNSATSGLSDNNASLVLLITYKDKTLLITSDIEHPTQQRLVTLYPHLHPDILIAPHHGSLTTLDKSFIHTLKPQYILCSCSQSNLQRNRVIQTPHTYHTPRLGAITVRLSEIDTTISHVKE